MKRIIKSIAQVLIGGMVSKDEPKNRRDRRKKK